MQKHYKEKALLATIYKIERLKSESGFFRKNWIPTMLFGIGASLLGPMYSSRSYYHNSGETALEKSGMPYWELVLSFGVFYFLAVGTAHVVWTFQEKSRMKKLLKLN